MKGIIFKHFETFVVDSFGAEVFEKLLEATELQTQGPFVGPETYPDADELDFGAAKEQAA